MSVIIDGSRSLQKAGGEALNWFFTEILGRILQEGDHLNLWIAAGKAELAFSGVLEAETGAVIRQKLSALDFSGAAADFAGAVRGTLRESAAPGGGLPAYTLLITGAAGFPEEAVGGNFTRYSRVEEFSGWRAILAAPGIDAQVREAASAFLRPGN
jgi:hypothetical protein